MLFDLIRNGLAHQYQQMLLKLTDGNHFYCTLSGVTHHRYLDIVGRSRSSHLDCKKNGKDLAMHVDPGALFVDFDKAINKSNLLENSCSCSFQYLSRPKTKSSRPKSKSGGRVQYYNFDSKSLEKSLVKGGLELR
jgi:hypothetical protein